LPSESWRESLAKLSPCDLSSEFNALVRKLVRQPSYIPTETELNRLICECMFCGKVEALRNMLAQLPVQTLHITKSANERAWQTLLEAMPASCSVTRLVLSTQTLDRGRAALLFEIMGRMPELESLHLDSCVVPLWTLVELPCPPLPELRNLHVKNTQTPYLLLSGILNASALNGLHLDNPGMNSECHSFFALALSKHTATLQQLTFKALGGDNLDPYVYVMQQTTKLAHLDLSRNALSPLTREGLLNALKDKSTLTSLSLAGCWHSMNDESDWKTSQRSSSSRALSASISRATNSLRRWRQC
jgi:hypothetical protein